jgi:hypothetical protein
MRFFYRWQLRVFEKGRTVSGSISRLTAEFISWWEFYLGPLLTVPLLALPWVIRQRKMRLPLLLCVFTALALAVETWYRPDYFSPATCALYLVIVQGMRHLWHCSFARRPLGSALVRAIPILACAMILIRIAAAVLHAPIETPWPRGNLERARILQQLQRLPGQQLVIVNYGSRHSFYYEWVYNGADIDAAKVLWARDMGNDGNQELLNYFKNRRIWRVDADASSPKLEPYQTTDAPK